MTHQQVIAMTLHNKTMFLEILFSTVLICLSFYEIFSSDIIPKKFY